MCRSLWLCGIGVQYQGLTTSVYSILMLLVGATMTGDEDMVACARATLRWYAENPGRYEITHVMGPLAAARLNARGGSQVDIDCILSAWFGDGYP